jgi:hypothetical protein
MSYETYKFIHIVGLILTLSALTILCLVNFESSQISKKTTSILHGLGLVLLLVAGFGMLAKLGIHGLPIWVLIKTLIWIWLGLCTVIIKRVPKYRVPIFYSVIVTMIFSTILGIYKI